MRPYREVRRSKFVFGPGGPSCSCCTKGHPRTWKPLERRATRRIVSEALRILSRSIA